MSRCVWRLKMCGIVGHESLGAFLPAFRFSSLLVEHAPCEAPHTKRDCWMQRPPPVVMGTYGKPFEMRTGSDGKAGNYKIRMALFLAMRIFFPHAP